MLGVVVICGGSVTLVNRVSVGKELVENSRRFCTNAGRHRGKVFRTNISSENKQTNKQ